VPDLRDDLRLGWVLAEVQGRHRHAAEDPAADSLPEGLLPLREQRTEADGRREARDTLVTLVRRARVDQEGFAERLDDALVDAGRRAPFFRELDADIQDRLTRTDERRANAYLLGRGLAECHWALDPATPAQLLDDVRRAELTRMLGRLPAGTVHPFTPAAVSGSLAAWGAVVQDDDWLAATDLRRRLREQVRGWYQLVVLGQDPTTLIRPYGKLAGLRGLGRGARLFWPQLLLALVALGLLTGFLTLLDHGDGGLLTSLLATSGLGAFTLAGLATRGQSAAQKLALRLRQDAYTDLVAVSLTIVPDPPPRRGRRPVERAVRARALTPPTPAP
jgi:hypothetical protein